MGNLKLGSRGEDVKQIQQYLKDQGLYSGAIDGIYGPKTMSAIQQVQQRGNIKVDGITVKMTNLKANL